MDQIEIVRRSLRCFIAGLFGIVPLLGLPGALIALLEYRAVTLRRGQLWNPAERYLFGGAVLAGLGLLEVLLIFGLVLFRVLEYLGS